MNIINTDLKFKREPTPRKATNKIILHHSDVIGKTVDKLNEEYKNRTDDDYIGIGYHYYVRLDGTVYRGRPENTIGAHCRHNNDDSIGICFEGKYENETKVMPAAQFNAGTELIKDILTRYPKIAVKKHNDFNNTACPGVYFPYNGMLKAISAPINPKPAPPKPQNPYAEMPRDVTLRNDSIGVYVKWLQTELNNEGARPKLVVDGIFGDKTKAAVKEFQRMHKDTDGKALKRDGIVGIKTRAALLR